MIVRLALRAMATRFELALEGRDEAWLRAVGQEALAEVEDCERRLDAFAPGSLLSLVNRRAAERPAAVDADTFALLAAARALSAETGGAFDPTLGELMRALGFRGAPPDPAALAAARAAAGADALELDPARATVRFARPGLALDLGAIAKGHALDRAAAVLREHGVAAALLHGGTSSAVALGAPAGTDGFRVALGREPDAPVCVLRDAALAVSAPHGRTVERAGARAGHVLDPLRGDAARGVALAAVVAPSARDADAWSTALVAGAAARFPSAAAARTMCALVARRARDDAPLEWRALGVAPEGRFPGLDAPAPDHAAAQPARRDPEGLPDPSPTA